MPRRDHLTPRPRPKQHKPKQHKPKQRPKAGGGATAAEAELEREKRVIVVSRLHQILEPFMLRRQVQDVEGKLPPKVPVIVKCPMSGYQSIM